MQHEVLLPQVELNMESVTVTRWLVAVGDTVKTEDPILEVETQKAVVEVPAPRDGVIRKLCVRADDEIGESALLCVMTDGADEPLDDGVAEASPRPAAAPRSGSAATGAAVADPGAASDAATGKIRATPLARKIAREQGLDLKTVAGTGPAGRISRSDVTAFLKRSGAVPPAEPAADEGQWTELGPGRVALIRQMQRALSEIPQVSFTRQTDVTPLLVKAEGVTMTHRLVRAIARALLDHPALRTVIDGTRVRIDPVSVAVAIETPGGLVAPAVRRAHEMSVAQIAAQVRDFADRAARGALKRAEMTDARFALSNLGMFNIDVFTPFVFHGQTAVLAVGRAAEAGAGRRVAAFTLAVDHRVVDGAEAARFLETLQQRILSSCD